MPKIELGGKAGVVIRLAEPSDAERIHEAIRAMGAGLGAAGKVSSTVEDFRRHGFGPNAAFTSLIAEVDEAFAGLALFFPIFSTWLGKPGVFVQDLYVDQAFRGRGVGEVLLRHVASWSTARGGVYLRLAVDRDNVAAQRFYQRLGIGWIEADLDHGAYGEDFARLARINAN
ncbi:GNAT family N-acetyltransferase [Ochrobactrum soli]|uniref:Acetyltransferase n=1 Tax=Ochrobactrum soli TaxID=2448455 RepID=A0A2P9HBL4_9HYPH|nr:MULTISPECIES: GNAT family N-acetyltransferase [Brucella]MCI1002258.1 GNAT family N-acetyltransferase [Ochrobactrum sp. C6C9]RRD25359.1 GNAT family N-acetyltransferase [Brucellaceae bacterium VT-16-1752]MDX4072056.1 GNAT family N-acetyltransferase [Brucella sp. NBRC 113783]RLL65499.1 GNAT family N-acetyltransferase [[Ochrobactrum] soli]SPL61493.1 acetyltransferase [[Ochrobactrum] soli]